MPRLFPIRVSSFTIVILHQVSRDTDVRIHSPVSCLRQRHGGEEVFRRRRSTRAASIPHPCLLLYDRHSPSSFEGHGCADTSLRVLPAAETRRGRSLPMQEVDPCRVYFPSVSPHMGHGNYASGTGHGCWRSCLRVLPAAETRRGRNSMLIPKTELYWPIFPI